MPSLQAHRRRHPHSAVRCNYQSRARSAVCRPILTAKTDWWPSWVQISSVGSPSPQNTFSVNFFGLDLPPLPTSETNPRTLFTVWIIVCPIIPNQGFITLPSRGQEIWLLSLQSQEEEEERANLTQLAWLAIIAPLLSVLERPPRCAITGRLPVAIVHPPSSEDSASPRRSDDGRDVPRLIKRGCGPLKNTVSISLWLLLPLINMQCSMKEHCHPRDMIFIVSACVWWWWRSGRTEVREGQWK